MLTLTDIQKKKFAHGVRGYREEDVEAFREDVIMCIETLNNERDGLRENIRLLTTELERYRGSESAIFNTLESAKALMTDISSSAEKRADIVLKNAELDAERIRRDAQESVERLTEEAIALSRRWELFKARFYNLLETELDRFDSFAADLLHDEPAPPTNTRLLDRTVSPRRKKKQDATDLQTIGLGGASGTIRKSK